MTAENESNPPGYLTGLLQSELKKFLVYDPETGIFKRRIDSNNRLAGTVCNSINAEGYITISVNNKRYLAHRLAWLYTYGEWPTGPIDHINRRRKDNRITNLRVVSGTQSNHNRDAQINNFLGIKGIRPHGNKYMARVTHNGVQHYLGLFYTIEEAVNARREKEHELFGEFAYGDEA